MEFVPWQQISRWRCTTCGDCCKSYGVVLNFHEWLRIIKGFGVGATATGIDKLCIKRVDDGSCFFLCRFAGTYFCGLQQMKPGACKLWPFKILAEPKYGQADQAALDYGDIRLFIYADSNCAGLTYGKPTWEFRFITLQEFVELGLGTRKVQTKTTSNLSATPNRWMRLFDFR